MMLFLNCTVPIFGMLRFDHGIVQIGPSCNVYEFSISIKKCMQCSIITGVTENMQISGMVVRQSIDVVGFYMCDSVHGSRSSDNSIPITGPALVSFTITRHAVCNPLTHCSHVLASLQEASWGKGVLVSQEGVQ